MTKDQSYIINSLMQKIASSLRVAMPACIETYDFKTQKADLKIDMQELYNDDVAIEYPILSGVPVIFPRCGGASITMPVLRGDSCLVIFLDRDSTAWLLGGKNLKPKSGRKHHLSDAVAIMGLSPFVSKSPAKNNTDMLINFDGSDIVLKAKGIIDIITAKEINVKTESLTINCKSANIKVNEVLNLECKTLTAKVNEVLNLECKTLTAKVAQVANISCESAIVKATSKINTETPILTQKGDLKIEGNVEITGTSKLSGDLTCTATVKGAIVKTSTNINLATHSHNYVDAVPMGTFTPTLKSTAVAK